MVLVNSKSCPNTDLIEGDEIAEGVPVRTPSRVADVELVSPAAVPSAPRIEDA